MGAFQKRFASIGFFLAIGFVQPFDLNTTVCCQEKPPEAVNGSRNWCISLYDTFAKDAGKAIPSGGYSVFIRYRGTDILFDGGASADILAHNAKALGVDLGNVRVAVVSHSHGDHTSGIDYLLSVNKSVKLYLPPDMGDASPDGKRYRLGYRYQYGNIEFIDKNTEILPGITLIATTSSMTGMFWKYPPYDQTTAMWGLPELSLALSTQDGKQMLFVGCSHSRVEEIVREARDSLRKPVSFLIGGFHLNPYKADSVAVIAKKLVDGLAVERVAPMHCTGTLADSLIHRLYPANYLYAGLGTRVILPP